MKKEYIKKDGTKSIYNYDDRKYNKKRNKKITRLQKLKSYYKRIKNFEKVKSIDIMINIEKRKNKKTEQKINKIIAEIKKVE